MRRLQAALGVDMGGRLKKHAVLSCLEEPKQIRKKVDNKKPQTTFAQSLAVITDVKWILSQAPLFGG